MYNIDEHTIKLVNANYDELDFNHKLLYKHYSECLISILNLTTLLISAFKENLSYLQPIFLEYSYSKEDYKKYRQIIKDLERQFKTFEKRFTFPSTSPDNFSQCSQSVLCISNQIKSYIGRLVNLLGGSDNSNINEQVNLIFSRSLHLCTHITYYTRQCRMDKNLFTSDDYWVEKIIEKDLLFDIDDITEVLKEKELDDRFKADHNCLNRQEKEQFPKKIKIEINKLLHDINHFDLLTETVSDKSIHKKNIEEKYSKIINCIEQYILEIINNIIAFLMNFHFDVIPTFLDYNIPHISCGVYLSSINQIYEFYHHSNCLKNYDDFEASILEFTNMMKEIIESEKSFSYLNSYYNTIRCLIKRIQLTRDATEKLKEIYDEHLFSIGDVDFINEQGTNQDYENDYGYDDYDDYDDGGYRRSNCRKSFK